MIRDIQKVSDDIIEMKRLIKQKLIADPDVLEALHNPDIDMDSPDEFLDNNIYDFIRVPKTQDTVRNFICFTVDDIEGDRWNEAMKTQYMQFYCISHLDDMTTDYGMNRCDLLGYLVRDIFNHTNMFGMQFKEITNKEKTMDSDYYCRILTFEASKLNHLNYARMDGKNDRFAGR